MPRTLLPALALTALALPLAACTSHQPTGASGGSDQAVTVTSTDDSCELSTDTAPSGTVVFDVTNRGKQVTEFYLLRKDGVAVAGEIENIGPGLHRQLVVEAQPGSYVTACKPGMKGKGLRAPFTVTDSGKDVSVADQQLYDEASHTYRGYVQREVEQLVAGTKRFVTAYKAGDEGRARALYPRVRTHWERIEPVAESFGDLDPKMDLREADLEPGQTWTGWHLLEKDLWWPKDEPADQRLTDHQRARYADRLLADTHDLQRRVQRLDYSPDQMANGAKELLDEVATGKVTGEEEAWSHTDLSDFQANVDGARAAFDGLRAIVGKKEPALGRLIEKRFDALQGVLDQHRNGDGFVAYTALTPAQVKDLADAVNALAEPLSRLTAAVVTA